MEDRAIHKTKFRRAVTRATDISLFYNANSNELISKLIDKTQLSQKSLANVFVMTEKTFSSYRNSDRKLNPLTAELAIKIMELYEQGKDTFGSLKRFQQWMTLPAPGLDGRVPFELIQTVTGVSMVMNEVMAIEHGMPI